MYFNLGKEVAEIAASIPSPRQPAPATICERTVKIILNEYVTLTEVTPPRNRSAGRKRAAHGLELVAIVEENPWLFIDEISEELRVRTGHTYHGKCCYEELVHRGLSLKVGPSLMQPGARLDVLIHTLPPPLLPQVMRERAAQRDESQRAMYWQAIFEECTDPAQLVFADETAKVDSVLRRKRGWGGRGQRVESVRLLHHSTHIAILALYGIGGFIDYDHVEGGYQAVDFMYAVENMIVPHLTAWPAPGSILVLDNCRIHHTYEAELRAMVEARGAKLLFLAPYSPIDSPIDPAFNCLKAYWARHEMFLATLPLDDAIRTALFGCYSDPAESARLSFSKCGYGAF